MSNREPKSSPDDHVKFAEMEHLKSEHHDIYESLMRTFKNDVRVCNDWLTKPKPPLQGRSPFEQLSIDACKVIDMLTRMKTGDFS